MRKTVHESALMLDEVFPGWWRKIDMETLDLSDSCYCVCGQLGRNLSLKALGVRARPEFASDANGWENDSPYEFLLDVLRKKLRYTGRFWGFPVRFGFITGRVRSYARLDADWTAEIRSRLEAEKVAA